MTTHTRYAYQPSPYQITATEFIETHPAAMLWLTMGLGKTVITLTAIADLMQTGEVERILVIAPLNVARTVWQEECEKWEHLNHIRCSKILGSRQDREAAMKADADLYIINRENVPWLIETCKKARRWPFDTVVIDELSSFKSRAAERWKALVKARKGIHRIIGLTGTPAPNGLIDLWPQVYLMDEGQRLGRTIGAYRNAFFRPDKCNWSTGQVYSYALLPGADQQIYDRIRDITVSMQAADYVTLPDRISRTVPVDLSAADMREYRRFARDLVLELDDEEITAASAAVLCNKLLQYTSGEIYDQDKKVKTIHGAKLDTLKEIIDTATSPVLVFYAFRHEADRIRQAIPDAVKLEGQEQVEAWNAGKLPVMLAHPDSAGHGLNLQAGGHIIVWYSLTWSLEKYQQACARLHRRGQTQPVIIHHLVARGTIDERVMQVLSGKADTQSALLQAVKAIRREVVGDESAGQGTGGSTGK